MIRKSLQAVGDRRQATGDRRQANYTHLLNNRVNYTLVYFSPCFIFFSYHIHLAINPLDTQTEGLRVRRVLQINPNKEF